jgi:peptide/nickel transport system substrate-binding protein
MRERLICVLVALAVVASACAPSTQTPAPSSGGSPFPTSMPSASATPQTVPLTTSTYRPDPALTTGGNVVLGEWVVPTTVNPYYAVGDAAESDMEVSDSMFEGLLKVTSDLKYVPDLAMNVPTVDNGGVVLEGNGMAVSWTLRPGMQWSDGKPINCNDIAATWQWIVNRDNAGLALGTIGWQDVTGVDGGTGISCVMHFGKVYEGYLGLVSPLLPAHYLTTIPVKDAHTKLYPLANLASGVYSGPYIPGSTDGKTKMTLKPNAAWQTISGHAPWLASVTWKFYADANSMIAGFKNGDYDVGQDLNNANLPALAGIAPSMQVVHDSMTYELLAFNNASFQTKFGTDAANVIQAIKLATDRKAIAQGVLGGAVSVTNNFVSPLAWYYKDINSAIAGDPTAADPATASALLANAGWTKGADGYLIKGGKPLQLSYCTTTRQYRLDTLQAMAAQLQQIGIKVQVNSRPDSDFFGLWDKVAANTVCNLRHGNFDVAEFAYVSPFDPLRGYRVYHSSEIPDVSPHDGENISRINLPALDADYDTIAGTADLSKVRAAMFAVQDIYGSDRNTYELPLYFRKDVWLVNPRLANFFGNPTVSGGEWNIGDWWVR